MKNMTLSLSPLSSPSPPLPFIRIVGKYSTRFDGLLTLMFYQLDSKILFVYDFYCLRFLISL
jgi:hypothetical protein